MLRRLSLLVLALILLPTTCLRDAPRPHNHSQAVLAAALPLPRTTRIGPFTLTGAWQLTSANGEFGGYSALLAAKPGWLVAFSDGGQQLDLPLPGNPGQARQAEVLKSTTRFKALRDIESASRDPASGAIWLALEGRNRFLRLDRGRVSVVAAPDMAGWSRNSGPEAVVRLADGRFVVLAEAESQQNGRAAHPALIYPGSPLAGVRAASFRFAGPAGYRPTDMAQLPDGRVLIVMRQLRWPLPPRFGTQLVLADPAEITPGGLWQGKTLTSLDGTGLEENYEGLAIVPGAGESLAAWLISDANGAVTQRTLLLRLEFRLADLPTKQKAPG
jgi:hypothetical protein